jgi:hypothetical protein
MIFNAAEANVKPLFFFLLSQISLKGLFSRRKLLICAIRHWENPIATNKIKIGELVVFLMSF